MDLRRHSTVLAVALRFIIRSRKGFWVMLVGGGGEFSLVLLSNYNTTLGRQQTNV
jgi:hypothetical protein